MERGSSEEPVRAPVTAPPPVWEALPRLALGDWWKSEDLPVAWGRYFAPGPLAVEVGFGGGDFLVEMATREPDTRFVGLERFGEGHRRLVAELKKRDLRNVLPVLGDAYILLQLLFEDRSLRSVFVNCPDPWPKARHARRRLLTSEFFALAGRKLEPGGRLFVATDDRPYAEAAAEAFGRVATLESTHPGRPWRLDSPYPAQTRYERRWTAEGRTMHYFVYARRSGCPT